MKRLITFLQAILLTLAILRTTLAENYALQFDGQNDLVDCGQAAELRQVQRNITIECWIKTEARDQRVMITNRHADDGSDFPSLLINNGLAGYSMDDRGVRFDATSQTNIADNQWHHLAGVRQGDRWSIYVDGQEEGVVERASQMDGSRHNLQFGHHGAWNNYYVGMIDDVRIWLGARSSEEIRNNMNVMLSGDEEGLYGYWNFDEGEGQTTEDLTGHGHTGMLGANNQAGQDDPRWVVSGAPIFGGTIDIDNEQINFPPVIRGNTCQTDLTITNTSEEQDDRYSVTFELYFAGERPNWLEFAPTEGRIEPGQEVAITFTADAAELQPSDYEAVVIFTSNSSNLSRLEIPVSITVTEGAGRIFGRVTDAATDEPFRDHPVSTDRQFVMNTDAEGYYEFAGLPATRYRLMVSRADYLSAEEEVDLQVGEEIELNFAILHSVCDPRPDSVEATIQFNDTLNTEFTIVNSGNGPLSWSSSLDFPDELEQEPWSLRHQYPISQITGDDRLQAVTFADEQIFVAGAANRNKLIYVLNRECELQRTFRQLSPSRYGFSGLTWDGELLWGAADNVIYGFNTAGDSITSFAGPHAPVSSNVVWDSDREVLWLSTATSDLISCNRAGEVQSTFDNLGLRVYGLGYYPEDPDGFNLYLFTNPELTRRVVMKMDPTNGDTMRVLELPDDGSRPAGCAITNLYDPYSWVFIGVGNNGPDDLLNIWHLSANTSWISTSPQSGVIEAGSTESVNVRLDTYGLTPEMVYETTIRLTHDGVGSVTDVPVNLFVTGAGGMTQRVVTLATGWNLISTNLTPEGAESFGGVVANLVDARQLILAKDGQGNFYWPDHNFNGIDGWNPVNGYWLKLSTNSELRLQGESLPGDTPIGLSAGWNTVSYLPRQPIPADVGLAELGGNLVIARDGRGRFYLPAYGFSDIDRLREGAGYQLCVHEAADLVYSRDGAAGIARRYSRIDEEWLAELGRSASMHNLLVLSSMEQGTRIEALTPSGVVAGRGVVGNDGKAGLTLWGDDPTTETIEGFRTGEKPNLRANNGMKIELAEVLTGDIAFVDGGWGVVEMRSEDVPLEFGLVSVYPNPFNNTIRIGFSLPISSPVRVAIFDVTGRQVDLITRSYFQAGEHKLQWNSSGFASGQYIVRLEVGNQTVSREIQLLK